MSLKVRTIAAVLLMVMVWMGLSGCLDHPFHHSRQEVIAYLEEAFPDEEITISKNYTEEPASYYDRTVRIWDCWFTDLPDAVFQVRSAWRIVDPAPMAGYVLSNDARRALYAYYLDRYLQDIGSLDTWEIEGNELTLSYTAMAQVRTAQVQLQAFYDWLMEQPHLYDPLSATCRLAGLPLPSNHLDTWKYIRPEATSWASACGDMVEVCAGMMQTYYAFYGLPCPEFSPEALEDYAQETWTWTTRAYPYPAACSRDGTPVPLSTFAGIGIQARYISYAGLYEMLVRLDLEPEGTATDFSFTGADGALYAFSYENVLLRDNQANWMYYLKDGELVWSNDLGAPTLYLGNTALEDMTGLHFIFDN